jgi:hypothetical protein
MNQFLRQFTVVITALGEKHITAYTFFKTHGTRTGTLYPKSRINQEERITDKLRTTSRDSDKWLDLEKDIARADIILQQRSL